MPPQTGPSRAGGPTAEQRPDLPLTVLRNDENQGYGGNQKVGYLYAIEEGFDIVALIHGDGQYAPEELPRLLAPVAQERSRRGVREPDADSRSGPARGDADVQVRGEQDPQPGAEFAVGGPALRVAQRLPDLPRGRAGTIAFLNNSNGFPFDTDVITQLLSARSRIAELPIPTYYGDEICRVEGVRYAAQVIRSCLRHALHRFHVRPVRALMPKSCGNVHYDAKVEFASSHSEALQAHPARAAGSSISEPARACSPRPSRTEPPPCDGRSVPAGCS